MTIQCHEHRVTTANGNAFIVTVEYGDPITPLQAQDVAALSERVASPLFTSSQLVPGSRVRVERLPMVAFKPEHPYGLVNLVRPPADQEAVSARRNALILRALSSPRGTFSVDHWNPEDAQPMKRHWLIEKQDVGAGHYDVTCPEPVDEADARKAVLAYLEANGKADFITVFRDYGRERITMEVEYASALVAVKPYNPSGDDCACCSDRLQTVADSHTLHGGGTQSYLVSAPFAFSYGSAVAALESADLIDGGARVYLIGAGVLTIATVAAVVDDDEQAQAAEEDDDDECPSGEDDCCCTSCFQAMRRERDHARSVLESVRRQRMRLVKALRDRDRAFEEVDGERREHANTILGLRRVLATLSDTTAQLLANTPQPSTDPYDWRFPSAEEAVWR